ncbi:MAG TPA: dihydroneopterin aldolase [Candidatus Angelobacter sp.]|nr:dihydroneopterin aldolase [Candidatus Angelobacter sp.]
MNDVRFGDRLSLLGMRYQARHGVHAHEKIAPQPFEVDVVLHADLSRAAKTDRLDATVDYAALRDLVSAIVTGPSFDLVEALAGAIARAALAATDPALVDAVEVRIRKPEALDGELDGPEVALLRRRG